MFDIDANDDIESEGDMHNGAVTNLIGLLRTTPFCWCDDNGTKAAVLKFLLKILDYSTAAT